MQKKHAKEKNKTGLLWVFFLNRHFTSYHLEKNLKEVDEPSIQAPETTTTWMPEDLHKH